MWKDSVNNKLPHKCGEKEWIKKTEKVWVWKKFSEKDWDGVRGI